MTDDQGKLGDGDWESALDEWETKSFAPEVARDAEGGAAVIPPAAGLPGRAGGRPGAAEGSLGSLSGEGTVIAPVPEELTGQGAQRVPSVARPPSSPPARRAPSNPPASAAARGGGLGQLFAKAPSQRPATPASPPRPGAPPVPTRTAPAAPRPAQERAPNAPPGEGPRLSDDTSRRPPAAGVDAPPSDGAFAAAALPSVTRQLVAPASGGEAYADEGEPTLVGRGLEEGLLGSATTTAAALPSVGDAPTVSVRDEEGLASTQVDLEPTRHPGAATETGDADRPAWRPRRGSDEETQARLELEQLPADDEAPTFLNPSSLPPKGEAAAATGEAPLLAAPRDGGGDTDAAEGVASPWLDGEASRQLRQRASWLEEEARALPYGVGQARALLGVSELLALAGDRPQALRLATEARDLAPDLALAWRQTRQLQPGSAQDLVAHLDEEAAQSPTPAARAHAVLLAADELRTTGDGDGAVERWNRAVKLDPADARAPAAQAALALAQGNHTSAGAALSENSELGALGRAVLTVLELRGAPRAGAEPAPTPLHAALRRARAALVAGDVVAAAQGVAELADAEPELTPAALWLSAALGATHIAGRRGAAKALRALATEGDGLARRQLAARGVELADPELIVGALAEGGAFDDAERLVLQRIAGRDDAGALATLATQARYLPLVDALSALTIEEGEDGAAWRAARAVGGDEARGLAGLGRRLASRAPTAAVDEALSRLPAPRGASAAGVALEAAVRAGRWAEVSDALGGLAAGDDARAHRHVAAALLSERAGDGERAKRAWQEALASGAQHDSVLRAIHGPPGGPELGGALVRLADAMPDDLPSAVLRLEVLARLERGAAPGVDAAEQASLLERVHRGAPTLGIGASLAERLGRRAGDVDEVLRWIQERRAYTNDALLLSLDAVREALLVADRNPDLASDRLEAAHRARPDDVALRELFERLAIERPTDRGAWREERARKSAGRARPLMLTEAALEYERASDHGAALRAATAAREAGDTGLGELVAERAEIATGSTARQRGELLAVAKDATSDADRRDAYERLATLHLEGESDATGACAWHQRILETEPGHRPSLRFVEHTLITEGRDAELAQVAFQIAVALSGTPGGEVSGHAQLAARLKARAADTSSQSGWEHTGDMARLAASQPEPSLWALRQLNAHARVEKDDLAVLASTAALLERTMRPAERAALLLRASEAAARLERVAEAREFLEQAALEDPGDVVTWGFLAEVRERAGDKQGAAEACESLARTSTVADHQVLAWFDAARIWMEEVEDVERAMTALEQCAEIDIAHGDVFQRLSALYAERRLDAELARLLLRRLAIAHDEGERVTLEVELARALGEMGDLAKAKASLESALAQRPDHTTALAAMAEVCTKEGDWAGVEQAYVRLARLLDGPEEQRAIYEKLGEVYRVHLVNLSRAEVAYKEVLKRAPGDLGTLAKLLDIYTRQGDVAHAVETQQQIVAEATTPDTRLSRLIDLAGIYEDTGRDARRAEQVLDAARKEYPTSVVALRALADLYVRQRQMPAMQILLDRAAGDARRSFAAGRFVTSLFEVLHAAYELRGRKDAARVVAATLAAVEGPTAPPRTTLKAGALEGGEAAAVDPRLDDLLAPELLGPALRALLERAGDSLDAVSPVDLRAVRAVPLAPGTPLGTTVGGVATVVGLGALQILVSPLLGRVAIPLGSNPPALLVGEALVNTPNERARTFVAIRALKMIVARSSSLLRGQAEDVSALVSGLFTAFNPSFVPQGVDPARVSAMSRRLVPALPRNLDPTVGVIALEAAGTLGERASQLGSAAQTWANRVALLGVGDPSGALDAIAWSRGEEAAPREAEARAAWIGRVPEARELMTFSVTDAYAEARARLGLDR